jgi:predicted lipoprotein with Yx(FWY)xxD motif
MSKKYFIIIVVIAALVVAAGYMSMRRPTSALMQVYPTATVVPTPTLSNPDLTPTPSNSNIYKNETDSVKGNYIADFAGMTLYIFDKDTQGVSNCNDQCAQLWPPYSSGATTESVLPVNISVITRTDGSYQFAWKGMPLYYYSGDKNPGDLMGDGFNGLWHIVKP